MVASKFLNDDGEEDEVFNSEWAKSGDLSIAQMNRLEKDFLKAIVRYKKNYLYFHLFSWTQSRNSILLN